MTRDIACPACGAADVDVFLRRENVPVHQNLLARDETNARNVPRGDLHMASCGGCGFVFNKAFDATRLAYGEDYENTQHRSPYFVSYLDELVQHLVDERDVRGKRIVEVGCGKGYFLRRLVSAVDSNSGIGFDPSYVGPESDLEGRLRFDRRFYGPDCANEPADVVVCRHVIEHVADPAQLLADVRLALHNSPAARVYFETPCVEWILRNQVIWDFFYEHCSLFSAASLATLFERAGFAPSSVRHVFNDQYLWIEATLGPVTGAGTRSAGEIPRLALAFADNEAKLTAHWRDQIDRLRKAGKVAVWGAGAKGSTFVNLVDPDRTQVDCVVDLNPAKQGNYIPGTGHPIVSCSELPARGVTCAILMNPNYLEENRALLSANQVQIELIH